MMVDIAGYYDENAEPSRGTGPVPAGNYRAAIVESKIEDISQNNDYGKCLAMTWKIEGGEYDGRYVWQRLNIWAKGMNNLDKVVQIANSQFAAIREATGKNSPKNTEELHQIPCIIGVKLVKSPGYSDKNEVSSVKAASSGATPMARPAGNSAPAAASKPAGSAPGFMTRRAS